MKRFFTISSNRHSPDTPAFYHAYLDMHDSVGHRLASTVLGKLLTALPQISVVVVIGARFARDLPLCLLMQTICFVTFNQVCRRNTSFGTSASCHWQYRYVFEQPMKDKITRKLVFSHGSKRG